MENDGCCQTAGLNSLPSLRALSHALQTHPQLVKNNDDLRQDAVMQQYFALVNALLAANAATARRRLCIATYTVVPFSSRAGVIQWVDNTVCLAEYLISADENVPTGAHERYQIAGGVKHRDIAKKVQARSLTPAACAPKPPLSGCATTQQAFVRCRSCTSAAAVGWRTFTRR